MASTAERIEIIKPGGLIEFYELDPVRGIANIGQDPSNDIIITGPGISPFVGVLDYRTKPSRFLALGAAETIRLNGEVVQVNESREIRLLDRLELDGHVLIMMDGKAVAAQPQVQAALLPPETKKEETPAVESELFKVLPPTEIDDIIMVEVEGQEWTIDTEQVLTIPVHITNGGPIVAQFTVDVLGLNDNWVALSPSSVNLNEGERTTIHIAITPPRLPSSRAGMHFFAIQVSSRNHPNRLSRVGCSLVITPYYDFSVTELDPRQVKTTWGRRTALTTLTIQNNGNSSPTFHLEGNDDERNCAVEFSIPREKARLVSKADFKLGRGQGVAIPIRITPNQRDLIAVSPRQHSITITTSIPESSLTPRAVLGMVQNRPLFGPWIVFLGIALAVLLVIFLFTPRITLYTSTPTNEKSIRAGSEVILHWDAFPPFLVDYTINGEPADKNSRTSIVHPISSTIYELRASTWLSNIIPPLSQPAKIEIRVSPVKPEILLFEATPDRIPTQGDNVIISWLVVDSDKLVLFNQTDGAETELESSAGSLEMKLEKPTIFILKAYNNSIPEKAVEQPVEIKSSLVASNRPVIERFSAEPATVIAGQPVEVRWRVSGVDVVSIKPIGDSLPPSGTISLSPTEAVVLMLTAANASASINDFRQIKVLPAPTPTAPPVPAPAPTPTLAPVPPAIDTFAVAPEKIKLAYGQQVRATLNWAITGAVTAIVLEVKSAPNSPQVFSGLSAIGQQIFPLTETTMFTITAYNGSAKVVKTIVMQVERDPLPAPTVFIYLPMVIRN
ncbi:MAG TPA: hypothetical protein PKW33_12310 [Anaerolineaceae bacterium]|nr:hypothetical protein [Anaerolineaceae bacterium]HPN52365.1 hypothetical protein [Anaerolineaceae bacterium]